MVLKVPEQNWTLFMCGDGPIAASTTVVGKHDEGRKPGDREGSRSLCSLETAGDPLRIVRSTALAEASHLALGCMS